MKTPICLALLLAATTLSLTTSAQPGPGFDPGFGRGPGGPGGFGGPPGRGEELKLLKKFDANHDKMLDATERKAALSYMEEQGLNRRRGPGGMRRGGGPDNNEPAQPGKKLTPADVKSYPDADVYDPNIIRTLFLEFDSPTWEKELMAFKNSDVELPAKITADGKTYDKVGVHFRGASSFMMVPEGQKHSINLTFDEFKKDQSLYGHRSLELLNSHEDPSFLRTVLFDQIARQYLPAAKANFMRVVINGENWGIYVNSQPFNKDFLKENYQTTEGVRWKTPGSPRGQASMKYLGDDPASYKRTYELKSKDTPKAWTDLIHLFKVLNETPPEKLESELPAIFDVDGALKFLALDIGLINNDGYWTRTSDYNLYQDTKGVFHVIPHDTNETFSRPEGPGGPRGPRGGPRGGDFGPRPDGAGPRPADGANPPPRGNFDGPPRGGGRGGMGGPQVSGVELPPLIGANDENKPLISKLFAVPAWRAKYLSYIRDIAEKQLDWKTLGPIASKFHDLIAEDIKIDTRKLESTEAFEQSLTQDVQGRGFGPGGGGTIALKNFADQRRAYLLSKTAN